MKERNAVTMQTSLLTSFIKRRKSVAHFKSTTEQRRSTSIYQSIRITY